MPSRCSSYETLNSGTIGCQHQPKGWPLFLIQNTLLCLVSQASALTGTILWTNSSFTRRPDLDPASVGVAFSTDLGAWRPAAPLLVRALDALQDQGIERGNHPVLHVATALVFSLLAASASVTMSIVKSKDNGLGCSKSLTLLIGPQAGQRYPL